MVITCPYCGPRDLVEFTYQGDATVTRPDQASTDQAAWNAYIYERANPAGPHTEYWQHAGGCRALLVVERNTVTHAVGKVRFAREKPAKTTPARSVRSADKAPAHKSTPKAPARKKAAK